MDAQSVGSSDLLSSTASYAFFEPTFTPASLTFDGSFFSDVASVPVQVAVYSCGSDTSCGGGTQYQTSQDLVAQGAGPSGALTFMGSPGTGHEV